MYVNFYRRLSQRKCFRYGNVPWYKDTLLASCSLTMFKLQDNQLKWKRIPHQNVIIVLIEKHQITTVDCILEQKLLPPPTDDIDQS